MPKKAFKLTFSQVILRYLKKIEMTSETATNGLECTEMVLSKPHSYYSLIIVGQVYNIL